MATDPSKTGGTGGYEPPGVPDSGGERKFAAPSRADLAPEAADLEATTMASGFGADLLALKAEIETRLCTQAGGAEVRSLQAAGGDNIVGVGLAAVDAEDLANGAAGRPGDPGLALFTVERVAPERLRAEVSRAAGARALSAVPVRQIPVGVVDALAHRFPLRPAPGGISVGHFAITAGTFGCLVVGNSAPRDQRLMVLSNNHVLANSNNAALGDCICQPGPADGGSCPADQIAILERFVPIDFSAGAFNFVDCATGWAWPDRVRRELVFLSDGVPAFFQVGATPEQPALGMIVGKSGRTTQLKQGRVTALNVTVNVNYNGQVAQFRDQFSVQGLDGDFSAGGDSGSLIWNWTTGVAPVGLLFAGGLGTTFGNRITRVLSDLDVRISV